MANHRETAHVEPRLYDVAAANDTAESEIDRLYNQANFGPTKELRVLKMFGLTDDMSVLEVASGPGFVTEWLSSILQKGSITCLDIDPALIDLAKEHLRDRARCECRFAQGSVMSMDFPDDSFDFAFARLIFMHLKDPVGAAKEIRRVLRPGGKLVVSETEYGLNHIVDPHMPDVQPLREKMIRFQESIGENTLIARRLWRILRTAGFADVDLEAVAFHSGEKGIDWFYPQINPNRIKPLIGLGVISEDEAELFSDAVNRFMSSEDPFYMRINIMAVGQKPGASQ